MSVPSLKVSASKLSALIAFIFLIIYNQKIWQIYSAARNIDSFQSVLELITFGLFLFFLLLTFFSLIAFKHIHKPILVFVFISAAIAMYFSNALNVYFNVDMVANIFETDYREPLSLW